MAQEYESVDLVADDTVRSLAGAAIMAALTAALAQLSIPLPGVTVTFSLQPFGSFFAGLLLGPVWGGFAMALYLAAGAAGAPVFSNGAAGIGHFGGKTGGFLVGFLLGAVVTGAVAHRRVVPRRVSEISVPVQLLALFAGLTVIYAVGVPWLAEVLGISVVTAAVAMAPLVALDVVKVGITIGVVEGGHLAIRE
ncbi:biotin transporter BioY [Halosimplex sp. TS25]|uniref:biotin transporter BioY n=1 Tax=Halosimplex rarum TaxID=3396619 RepID=UPI0039ECB11D